MKRLARTICIVFCLFFTNKSLEAQNICQQQKKEITKFISRFENLQKGHQAKEILRLFTASTEPDDLAAYSFLAGLDTAGPRLYSTGITTAFELRSFKIVDIYQSGANGCIVNVIEKRKYYPHGDYRGKTSTARHVLNFELLYRNDFWWVDSYRPYGFLFGHGRFGGFEF